MNPLILFGAIGLLAAASGGGLYLKGRADCNQKHLKAELDRAADEVEEKARDDALQAESAAADADSIKGEIARLRRILAERNANDTATSQCGLAGESDSVLDAHAEIFETGLPAGGRLDGGG